MPRDTGLDSTSHEGRNGGRIALLAAFRPCLPQGWKVHLPFWHPLDLPTLLAGPNSIETLFPAVPSLISILIALLVLQSDGLRIEESKGERLFTLEHLARIAADSHGRPTPVHNRGFMWRLARLTLCEIRRQILK